MTLQEYKEKRDADFKEKFGIGLREEPIGFPYVGNAIMLECNSLWREPATPFTQDQWDWLEERAKERPSECPPNPRTAAHAPALAPNHTPS